MVENVCHVPKVFRLFVFLDLLFGCRVVFRPVSRGSFLMNPAISETLRGANHLELERLLVKNVCTFPRCLAVSSSSTFWSAFASFSDPSSEGEQFLRNRVGRITSNSTACWSRTYATFPRCFALSSSSTFLLAASASVSFPVPSSGLGFRV